MWPATHIIKYLKVFKKATNASSDARFGIPLCEYCPSQSIKNYFYSNGMWQKIIEYSLADSAAVNWVFKKLYMSGDIEH